jgi:hypothetical protein
VVFVRQNGFAINNLDSALMAGGGALPTTGTFFWINFDYCFFQIKNLFVKFVF